MQGFCSIRYVVVQANEDNLNASRQPCDGAWNVTEDNTHSDNQVFTFEICRKQHTQGGKGHQAGLQTNWTHFSRIVALHVT